MGKVFITSQNHGYVVTAESVDPAVAEVSHINVNEGSVEGLRYRRPNCFTVQFHPEASPGPWTPGSCSTDSSTSWEGSAMPKREDIHRVLVIGSGPIVIGQAAEFDYAGTQACRALKEEGVEVVLVNSNPATIMTDKDIADHVYIEPLNLASVEQVIAKERPDSILPTLGGQTGLNLAVQLAKKGILKECQVEILGTSFESIERAEDRELFKELCESLGEPVIESKIAMSVEEAVEVAAQIGYPVVLRPAYTLGGTGGASPTTRRSCAR